MEGFDRLGDVHHSALSWGGNPAALHLMEKMGIWMVSGMKRKLRQQKERKNILGGVGNIRVVAEFVIVKGEKMEELVLPNSEIILANSCYSIKYSG